MAGQDKTVDLTPKKGMDLRSLTKQAGSPFMQNVLPRNGEFLVRPGFGLVREYDTTLNGGRKGLVVDPAVTSWYGIGAPIGKAEVKTSWGAVQIVVAHPVYAFAGNLRTLSDPTAIVSGQDGVFIAGVSMVVHDLNSGKYAEFVLHYQDSQRSQLRSVYPHYATRLKQNTSLANWTANYLRWAQPQIEPKWATFLQLQGLSGVESDLLCLVDGLGVWTYRPVDFSRVPNRQNMSLDVTSFLIQAGETCAFSPMNLCDGAAAAGGTTYLQQWELGQPNCMGLFGRRVVYGVGSTLYFSDPNRPDNIIATNFYQMPTQDTITGLATIHGGLWVSISRGCWIAQVVEGSEITTIGNLSVISTTTGAVTNQAYVVADDGVYGCNDSGCFVYSGGVQLRVLSQEIDRLWTDPRGLEMPLTDYYVKAGQTALTDPQLPARYDSLAQLQGVRLSWSQYYGALFLTCDDFVLVWFKDFGWTVWYFKTHAGSASQVQGRANIATPYMCCVENRLLLVGGSDLTTYTDFAADIEVTDSSCYLLEMGRGGAIDRSTGILPIRPNVYTFTVDGVWAQGDKLQYTLDGTLYGPYTVLSSDMESGYPIERIATDMALLAAADPTFTVTASGNVVTAVETNPAGSNLVCTSAVTVGSGTFTTAQTVTPARADISEAYLEDQRQPIGGWLEYNQNPGKPTIWIGEPVMVPSGFKTPLAQTLTVKSYWYPISIGNYAANGANQPTQWSLKFDFDNAVFEPITGTGVNLDYILPSQRLASTEGYKWNAGDAGRHAWVSGASQIDILFDSALVPVPQRWDTWPYLNLDPIGPEPVIWIGFKRVYDAGVVTALTDSLNLVTSVAFATMDDGTGGTNCSVYTWLNTYAPSQYNALANKQQPVDWVVKTPTLSEKDWQIRMRGVYLTALHMGNGTDDVVYNWLYGPMNTTTSTDMRDYSAQAFDFAPNGIAQTYPDNVAGVTQQTNILEKARLRPLNSSNSPTLKTFNNIAKWGSTASTSAGNLLIDDAAVDTLGTSDGSQGVRASVMVHGTMNSPGESVRLSKIAAVVRLMGGLRRWHA